VSAGPGAASARPAAPSILWRCRDRLFDLGERSLVMGVLNVTPDSFSDGGRYFAPDAALARGRELIAQGADLIDLGAESTRPGSAPVPADEQWRRLEPVLGSLAAEAGVTISVDTSSAAVARRALQAGARIVNDVTALADPEMPAVVAAAGAGLVLMHMQGTPADMQRDPRYEDAAREVKGFLGSRMDVARRAGVADERIALDPGIGFGKRERHSLELIARIESLAALGRPVVIGASRKSFIGRLLDLPVDQRLEAGLAVAAIAVFLGARIVRTHDVPATVRAVRMADVLRGAR
jgi:dihydropteroate synthase